MLIICSDPSCFCPMTPLPTCIAVLNPSPSFISSASSYRVLSISLFTPCRPLLAIMKSPVELAVNCRDRQRKEDMDLPGPFSACVLLVILIYTAPSGVNTHSIMWFVNVAQHKRSPSVNRERKIKQRGSAPQRCDGR